MIKIFWITVFVLLVNISVDAADLIPESIERILFRNENEVSLKANRPNLPEGTVTRLICGKKICLPPPLDYERNFQAERTHAIIDALRKMDDEHKVDNDTLENYHYGKHKQEVKSDEKWFGQGSDDFSWILDGHVGKVAQYDGTLLDLLKTVSSNTPVYDQWSDNELRTRPFGVIDDISFCFGEYSKFNFPAETLLSYTVYGAMLFDGIYIEIAIHCERVESKKYLDEMNVDIISWRDAILAANGE